MYIKYYCVDSTVENYNNPTTTNYKIYVVVLQGVKRGERVRERENKFGHK